MNRPDIKRLPKRSNPLEAQKTLLDAVRSVIPSETIPVEECLGRVLAKDVLSNITIPEYDKTFIDGYAINTAHTQNATPTKPAAFKITAKLFPADYPTTIKVARGEAVYVACGSPIPEGATATVKVEETRLKGGSIEVVRAVEVGEGVIPRGDDVKKGEVVLRRGQVLRPQDVGLLASVGFVEVEVAKKPVVAIISGGDELLRECQKNPKKIVNNYALVVAGLASGLGADPKIMGIMPDDEAEVQTQIAKALAESDIVVTIGGSSVGVKDFVPDAVNALGKPGVVVQGILLRPGAVSGFGIVDGKPVVMLPGHIGSCIGGFYMFVAPLISQYIGLGGGNAVRLTAELDEALENGPQFRFLLTKLKRVDGKYVASQVEGGSSALTTIVKSNGYAIVPPHAKLVKGDVVDVYLFGLLELTQFGV
jgi:molybdopterin molybdotransferase